MSDWPALEAINVFGVRNMVTAALDENVRRFVHVSSIHAYMPSAFGRVLRQLAHGSMPVVTESGYTWVDVRDLVRGMLAVWELGRSGEKYMLSGHWQSIMDTGRFMAALTGMSPPRLAVPLWVARLGVPVAGLVARLRNHPPAYMRASLAAVGGNHRISGRKAERELDYRPRPIERTLTDTACWDANHGLIRHPLKLSQEEFEASLIRTGEY